MSSPCYRTCRISLQYSRKLFLLENQCFNQNRFCAKIQYGVIKNNMAAYVVKAPLRTVTPLCMGYGSCSLEIWNLREILSQLKKRKTKIDAFKPLKLNVSRL